MPQNESESYFSILYLFNKETVFSYVSYLNFKESVHKKKKFQNPRRIFQHIKLKSETQTQKFCTCWYTG